MISPVGYFLLVSFIGGFIAGVLVARWWGDEKSGISDDVLDAPGSMADAESGKQMPHVSKPSRRRTGSVERSPGITVLEGEIPFDEITSPGPLLTAGDRDRLIDWMREAEETLKTSGSINKAWSSGGMLQIKSWLASSHKKPVEALDVLERFRQVLMEGLIHSAELTGPILVKLRENSGVSPDQNLIEDKLAGLREETAHKLAEIRASGMAIPVSPQNEFRFT